MSDDQRTPAEQEELLALQAMRAALESLRTTTGTLADDLDKAKGSYGKFTKVGEGWKEVLEGTAEDGRENGSTGKHLTRTGSASQTAGPNALLDKGS